MPAISSENKRSIAALKNEYNNQPWYLQWLFPSSLASALDAYDTENPDTQQALAVYQSFSNQIWFFQYWIFACLTVFADSPLMKAFNRLCDMPLFETGAFELLASSDDPLAAEKPVEALYRSAFISGADAKYQDALAQHPHPLIIAQLFTQFADLFNPSANAEAENNFDTLIKLQEHLESFAPLFTYAEKHFYSGPKQDTFNDLARFCSQAGDDFINKQHPERLQQLMKHGNLLRVASLFNVLYTNELIVKDARSQTMFDVLTTLVSYNIDTEVFHNLVLDLLNTSAFSGDMKADNLANWLTHSHLKDVTNSINISKYQGLLNTAEAQNNITAILQHANPSAVSANLQHLVACGALSPADKMQQANFNIAVKGDETSRLVRFYNSELRDGVDALANRAAILACSDESCASLISALEAISQNGLLSGNKAANANRDTVAAHALPELLAHILIYLKGADLLPEQAEDVANANRRKVAGLSNTTTRALHNALIKLDEAGLFTKERAQKTLDALITYKDILLKTDSDDHPIWKNYIQPGMLTEDSFDAICSIAKCAREPKKGQEAFQVFVYSLEPVALTPVEDDSNDNTTSFYSEGGSSTLFQPASAAAAASDAFAPHPETEPSSAAP